MNIELIYDADCPNVAATRSLLIRAFTQTGISARWKEWERSSPASPSYVQDFGSPSLLVDGHDIAGLGPSPSTRACRVYLSGNGKLQATPPLALVCAALLRNAPTVNRNYSGKSRWQALVASFPAIGTALLPKLTCPLCWPAYAALLSALGLGFFDYTPYLLPFTLLFLAVTVGALAIHARRSGQRAALITGIAGAAIVLLGKFAYELDWLNTAGIGLLVVAILISMRRRSVPAVPCPACVNVEREPRAEAS